MDRHIRCQIIVYLPDKFFSELFHLNVKLGVDLINKAGVVITPGCGFGSAGEGWFRATAFADRGRTIEAMSRIKEVIM